MVDITSFPEESFEYMLSFLDHDRRMKTVSYRNHDDQLRSLTAGLIIRMLEKRYGTVSYIGPSGKPLMQDGKTHFNLSHSGDLVVCAVSDNPIGIDVQTVEKFDDGLLAHVLTPSELVIFDGNGSDILFTDIWASKESYVKAIGTGLYTDPKTFSVLTDRGFVVPGKDLMFTDPGSDMKHRIRICHSVDDPEVVVKRMRYPELMSGC
ncbi:MAG: 4'-phosphopantetheinyl transferase superfamily protein [archaeon]|nr:4'-phosphopantetheinyl transferase superfamily protein [archaeon]